MSFFFRPPPFIRQVPVAVAVLFSAPQVDSPPAERLHAQMQWHAARRPLFSITQTTGRLDAALYPVVVADEPIPSAGDIQARTRAAFTPPWQPYLRWFPLATPHIPSFDDPIASQSPSLVAFRASQREPFRRPVTDNNFPSPLFLEAAGDIPPPGLALDAQRVRRVVQREPAQRQAPDNSLAPAFITAPTLDSPNPFLDAAGAARASLREPFRRPVTDNSLSAPLLLLFAGELPAIPLQNAQVAAWAAYRLPWARQAFQVVPAALIAAPTPDSPPTSDLGAQQAFLAAYRPPWNRPPFRILDSALFPVVQVDSPPTLALDAQGMFFAGTRLPWRRPPFNVFPAGTYTIDSPPIAGFFAQEAYKAAFRAQWLRPPFWTLPPALFPAVVVDTPPISDLRAQQAWWTASRRPLVDYLRSIPRVHESFLSVVESGDHAAIMLRLDAIDAALAAIQLSVDENHTLIANLQTGLNILILASSTGSSASSTQYADIVEKLDKVIKQQKTMLSDQTMLALKKKERST